MNYVKLFEDFFTDDIDLLPKVIETTFDGKRQLFKLNVSIDEEHREYVIAYTNKKGYSCLKLAHYDIEILVEMLLEVIMENERFKIIE